MPLYHWAHANERQQMLNDIFRHAHVPQKLVRYIAMGFIEGIDADRRRASMYYGVQPYDVTEICIGNHSVNHNGIAQVRPFEVRAAEVCAAEIRAAKVRAAKVRAAEV